jgi:hypothetical protein
LLYCIVKKKYVICNSSINMFESITFVIDTMTS